MSMAANCSGDFFRNGLGGVEGEAAGVGRSRRIFPSIPCGSGRELSRSRLPDRVAITIGRSV